jgi:hypothetical protein
MLNPALKFMVTQSSPLSLSQRFRLTLVDICMLTNSGCIRGGAEDIGESGRRVPDLAGPHRTLWRFAAGFLQASRTEVALSQDNPRLRDHRVTKFGHTDGEGARF